MKIAVHALRPAALLRQPDTNGSAVLLAALLFNIAFFDQLVDSNGHGRQRDAALLGQRADGAALRIPFADSLQQVHLPDGQVSPAGGFQHAFFHAQDAVEGIHQQHIQLRAKIFHASSRYLD
ncbi:hypothetical protein SDC9_198988 [bioreactor metagenome]|uniref:Uncharacterized protein n=1 Tax=bioreactor metagenome TaxID=1076179 RepID=A0A645IJ80_9ZZZZ